LKIKKFSKAENIPDSKFGFTDFQNLQIYYGINEKLGKCMGGFGMLDILCGTYFKGKFSIEPSLVYIFFI